MRIFFEKKFILYPLSLINFYFNYHKLFFPLSWLSGYDLEDNMLKDFVLNTYYQYQCFDELTIFTRSGNINWSEPFFAKKLIIMLTRNGKVTPAFDFVALLFKWDSVNNTVDPEYEKIFGFFVETIIE